MNGFSKRLLGLASGAAALTLVAGIAPASADFLTINPASSNGGLLTPDPAAGTFSTDGGRGWAAFGATVFDGGIQTDGTNANFSVWGAVDIDKFLGSAPGNLPTFTSGTQTCVGNDSSGCGWTFFATVHVVGNGTWGKNTTGVFETNSASTIELKLWALQGNVTTFGGANVTPGVNSFSDFPHLGMTGNANVECYTSGGDVGTGGSRNCIQVAETTGSLAGSFFTIDDTAPGGSHDAMTFNISTMFEETTFTQGNFWVSPPDPTSFGLAVL